jgi:7-keto-8-aminopelargonate synthetase-like enzyme
MVRIHRYRTSPTRSKDLVCRLMAAAAAKGTMLRTAGRIEGRRVELDGRMLYNFGTCSYLALERSQALRDGAIAALQHYGTQFSISRVYLECPLYLELEHNLERMTGRPVLVAPSTTLAHFAALPALVRDHDAVLIDQFAHASLHSATELLGDVPVHLVRHSRIDLLDELISKLSPQHEHIWFVFDGLYSMFGGFAPFKELSMLLQKWDQLHLYVDDAHATGWLGTHGRGGALTALGSHERVVVALSLNKSFAAAGGALAVPRESVKTRIRQCGGPMLFSGPIQPPMLGTALASSRLHLDPGHAAAQQELLRRIEYTQSATLATGLSDARRDSTPIFFIPCDSIEQATSSVRELMSKGFYICPSAFPAVPINSPGIRFTVTLHNELGDIDAFLAAAREVIPGSGVAADHNEALAGQEGGSHLD